MKRKLLLILALITGSMGYEAAAQLHVNVNIGAQPQWGPAGYERADYYYLPDVDAYYNVQERQFVYMEGRNWVFASGLPFRYRNYNLDRCYKVVLNEPRPWMHHNQYRDRYAGYRGNRNQVMIGDRRDDRRYDRRDDRRGDRRDDRWGRDEHRGRGRGGDEHGNRGNGHRGHEDD